MAHLTTLDLASRAKPMAKRWIAKATSGSHGQLRKKAEAAGKSTRAFASEHEHDSGKTGEQARLAETLMGMHHGKKKRSDVMYDHPTSRK